MEYLPTALISDKEFFDSTGLSKYDTNKQLNTMISFGLVGIQKAFIRKYYNKTVYKKVNTHILDTRKEFEEMFKVNFESDFKEIYSYVSK